MLPRLLAVLVLSAVIFLTAASAPAAATDCQFVLGFKTLHDLIPVVVGDCRTDEYHNAQNGDGLQETTGVDGKGGLLVWRKADNWTAFTDGYRTWVNGPNGLQSRLNTERFPWESRYSVAPVLGKAIRDYPGAFMGLVAHNYPGVALEPAHETQLSEQAFGGFDDGFCGSKDSLFLWREDTRQIYFLISGSTGLHIEQCRDSWEVFADTWKPGDPNNEDLQAPVGAVVPRGGIGKVWRRNFFGRNPSGLGFPKAPERYVVGTVQPFEHATAFYLPDTRAIYVLFDRFEFWTRSGLDARKVWFRVE